MRQRRALLSILLIGTGLTLAGCETFDLESIWSSKKPLPGERREMFPQGVPGVQQGVPPDLVQGYQPPAEPPPVAAAPEKPKPAPRRVASPPKPAPPPPRQQQQQAQETPPPAPPQQSGAAWPDPPSRTAQPQQSGPAWPDPPRSGTTTR